MTNVKLTAKTREMLGKNCTKKIRAEKDIPGAVFAKGEDTLPITISAREFDLVFKEAGMTSIVDVDVDGKTYPTIIKQIDKHPFKNQILHVNFQKVRMDEAIRVEVPIEFLNKDSIRVQPSVFMQVLTHVNVECLPGDIPEHAAIDVGNMEMEQSFTIADLDIANNKKVTILDDLSETICVLTYEKEEVEETETSDAADVPVIGEEEKSDEE